MDSKGANVNIPWHAPRQSKRHCRDGRGSEYLESGQRGGPGVTFLAKLILEVKAPKPNLAATRPDEDDDYQGQTHFTSLCTVWIHTWRCGAYVQRAALAEVAFCCRYQGANVVIAVCRSTGVWSSEPAPPGFAGQRHARLWSAQLPIARKPRRPITPASSLERLTEDRVLQTGPGNEFLSYDMGGCEVGEYLIVRRFAVRTKATDHDRRPGRRTPVNGWGASSTGQSEGPQREQSSWEGPTGSSTHSLFPGKGLQELPHISSAYVRTDMYIGIMFELSMYNCQASCVGPVKDMCIVLPACGRACAIDDGQFEGEERRVSHSTPLQDGGQHATTHRYRTQCDFLAPRSCHTFAAPGPEQDAVFGRGRSGRRGRRGSARTEDPQL
ncbi:hypothetical protein BKA56DRAFT_618067 [Ilyonectria sp. MPI-CAGE-AT-0026]|nr:hypothetical protein BKA56DRAFT_618067 [Ilyonectria sp. MPI-CAGE-AT-0026]